ncbi:unnamed protein product, partial [Polarella glacialis]
LTTVPAEPSTGPLEWGSAHHVKAWRFEIRGSCFAEAPVILCDDQGLFRAQLHRSSSYLILHIRVLGAEASGCESGPALDEFSSRAGAICTPRGLATPMVSLQE